VFSCLPESNAVEFVSERKMDIEQIDHYTARISALFMDFLTIDIEDREWSRLQKGLERIVWQIQAGSTDGKSVGSGKEKS
jgi:hypothetical protein